MPVAKERLITPQHVLSMTSGINDQAKLIKLINMTTYISDAGMRWSYHNIFQKLIYIVDKVSHQDYYNYFNQELKNKIGMKEFWDFGPVFKTYHSDTRSMARFGILALNIGKWKENQIINKEYFTKSISSSQSLNPAYGYMWWLNGKSSFMIPENQEIFKGSLIQNAPDDMYLAMGFDQQKIYIIPSKNMVIIRMGKGSDAGSSPESVISNFDNIFWEKFSQVIN